MSAPRSRGELFRSMCSLIAAFRRTADAPHARVLDRMDSEFRYGPREILDHVYDRYCHWWQRQTLDSAAVRLAEGEFYSDVEDALIAGVPVLDAMRNNAKNGQRGGHD